MIEYVNGDITEAPEFVVAHGCNAQGAMNSGVAKAIATKWPHVKLSYLSWHCMGTDRDYPFLELGEVQRVFMEDKIVLNLITQKYYGRDGAKYVSYDAIDKAFEIIADDFVSHSILNKYDTLAIPKIGAGLGGGDWDVISTIINKRTPNLKVKVYCYD